MIRQIVPIPSPGGGVCRWRPLWSGSVSGAYAPPSRRRRRSATTARRPIADRWVPPAGSARAKLKKGDSGTISSWVSTFARSRTGSRSSALASPFQTSDQTLLAHQASDVLGAALPPFRAQSALDARGPIGPAAVTKRDPHLRHQHLIHDDPPRRCALLVSIEPGWGDLQHAAQDSHGKLTRKASDLGASHRDAFAKYATVFYRRPPRAAASPLRGGIADSPAPASRLSGGPPPCTLQRRHAPTGAIDPAPRRARTRAAPASTPSSASLASTRQPRP